MDKKRFKLRCPEFWKSLTFEESTYDEVIKIEKGIGYCNSLDSAMRLEKFGYSVEDLHKKEKAVVKSVDTSKYKSKYKSNDKRKSK